MKLSNYYLCILYQVFFNKTEKRGTAVMKFGLSGQLNMQLIFRVVGAGMTEAIVELLILHHQQGLEIQQVLEVWIV